MFGKLAGYKTYITVALAVIGAVLGYLTGELSAVQAAQIILPAVIGGTLRNALNTVIGRALEKAIVELLEAAAAPAPLAPVAVQTVAPPQSVQVPSATPLDDTAKALAPVAVDVIQAVKAIIAASEGKHPASGS